MRETQVARLACGEQGMNVSLSFLCHKLFYCWRIRQRPISSPSPCESIEMGKGTLRHGSLSLVHHIVVAC